MLQLRMEIEGMVQHMDYGITWTFRGGKYSTTEVWNFLRPRNDKLPWYKLIWGSKVVPKHAFISWLAILNRLPTKDRLIRWDLNVDEKCFIVWC